MLSTGALSTSSTQPSLTAQYWSAQYRARPGTGASSTEYVRAVFMLDGCNLDAICYHENCQARSHLQQSSHMYVRRALLRYMHTAQRLERVPVPSRARYWGVQYRARPGTEALSTLQYPAMTRYWSTQYRAKPVYCSTRKSTLRYCVSPGPAAHSTPTALHCTLKHRKLGFVIKVSSQTFPCSLAVLA